MVLIRKKVLYLSDKYNIKASNVTYTIVDENHNKKSVTTKQPVLIGEMFTLLLIRYHIYVLVV